MKVQAKLSDCVSRYDAFRSGLLYCDSCGRMINGGYSLDRNGHVFCDRCSGSNES